MLDAVPYSSPSILPTLLCVWCIRMRTPCTKHYSMIAHCLCTWKHAQAVACMHQRTRVGALHSQDSKDHICRVLTLGDMMCIYASQKRHEHDLACALGPSRKRYTTNLPSNHIFRRNDERNHRRAVAASVFVAFSSHAIVSADKNTCRPCGQTRENARQQEKDKRRATRTTAERTIQSRYLPW